MIKSNIEGAPSLSLIKQFDTDNISTQKRFNFFSSDNHPGISIRSLIRCSCLPIAYNQGKNKKIEKSKRFCPLYKEDKVEDGRHFLVECSHLETLLHSFLKELRDHGIAKISPPLSDSNKNFLLRLLIGDFHIQIVSENKPKTRLIVLNYLLNLWNFRQEVTLPVSLVQENEGS